MDRYPVGATARGSTSDGSRRRRLARSGCEGRLGGGQAALPVGGSGDVGGGEVTLAPDRRHGPAPHRSPVHPRNAERPVEFWPTSAIRSALEGGDIATWKQIAVAIKRDPYGRTARQVEEVLESSRPYGISKALAEVLDRARAHLEANERTEVARHVRVLIERSGLKLPEFASRIGVPVDELSSYLDATTSPSASLMIRMRRLSDRFAKARSHEPPEQPAPRGPQRPPRRH